MNSAFTEPSGISITCAYNIINALFVWSLASCLYCLLSIFLQYVLNKGTSESVSWRKEQTLNKRMPYINAYLTLVELKTVSIGGHSVNATLYYFTACRRTLSQNIFHSLISLVFGSFLSIEMFMVMLWMVIDNVRFPIFSCITIVSDWKPTNNNLSRKR